jgi:hypothetical protein
MENGWGKCKYKLCVSSFDFNAHLFHDIFSMSFTLLTEMDNRSAIC